MTGIATASVVELLQQLIRHACVNDGTPDSGGETRNADVLRAVLEGPGVELESYARRPDRANVVARICGARPGAPSLCLLGHTDVVPAQADRWARDPFGGEVVDGFVWGRGAIDMLNMTGSMALAMRLLADSGFRPQGDLVFVAVADEESGGDFGARFLVEEHGDAVRADYVVTESGGMPLATPSGTALPVLVAERGLVWPRLTVTGTPGHGSLPYATDNALVKAAEVVRRLAAHRTPIRMTATWQAFLAGMGLPDQLSAALTDPEHFDTSVEALPPGLAKLAFSSTRTTITPTQMSTENKTNVIPDRVEIRLDVRTMLGDDADSVHAMIVDALADLAPDVAVEVGPEIPPTASPTETPLWQSLARVAKATYSDSHLVPMLMVGGTDNRFFRQAGAVGYGYGAYSRRLPLEELGAMGHGDNERVDLESLGLLAQLWPALAHDFLG